jgi:hypothetical protein
MATPESFATCRLEIADLAGLATRTTATLPEIEVRRGRTVFWTKSPRAKGENFQQHWGPVSNFSAAKSAKSVRPSPARKIFAQLPPADKQSGMGNYSIVGFWYSNRPELAQGLLFWSHDLEMRVKQRLGREWRCWLDFWQRSVWKMIGEEVEQGALDERQIGQQVGLARA